MPDPSGTLTQDQFNADVAAGRAVPQLNIGPTAADLTPEAAQAYANYDQQQLVDRQEYWAQERARQEQALADELKRQQAAEAARAAASADALRAEIARRMAPAAPLLNAVNTYSRIGQQTKADAAVNVTDFGYDPANPQTWAAAEQAAHAEEARRAANGTPGVHIVYPGQDQTLGQTVSEGLGEVAKVASGAYNIARTEIPGAQQVANVAGQVGEQIGQHAIGALTVPGAEYLPGVKQASDVLGKGYGLALESLVPTEVWQAALTLLPAAKARSIPELLSAITIGDKDALTAIKQAGAKLGESPAVEHALQIANGEAGRLVIPGTKTAITHESLAEAPQVLSTSGVAYHGTGARFRAFNEGSMDATALYGPGVYLTDDANIAKSYAETRASQLDRAATLETRRAQLSTNTGGFTKFAPAAKGIGEATIQTVSIKPGLRILNMERSLTADVVDRLTIAARANAPYFDGSAWMEALDAAKAGKPGKDVYRAFRNALADEGMSHADAGESLQGLNSVLQDTGYNGIAHQGGIQGGAKHTVTILFNPNDATIVTPMTRALALFKGGEGGFAKIPGKATQELSPEATARIAALTEQKNRATAAIKILSRGEQAKVTNGGIKDVLSVAERYAADSPQRAALMEVMAPKIAHLPEVDQKFIRAALDTLPTKAERVAATEAQHARQAMRAGEGFSGAGTEAEKAVSALKAMGGKQAQRFDPIGGKFTDQETAALFNRITEAADAKKIGIFDRLRANSALTLLMTGHRLEGVASEAKLALNLAPHEIKLLGRIFGPEFESAIPKSAAHLSKFEKFIDVLNLPRALVTALDFSAAGRQGIVLSVRNPNEFRKSFAPMINAMGRDRKSVV